ncbi:hypothetical protein H0H93_012614, partial [Arthromyces matolae]
FCHRPYHRTPSLNEPTPLPPATSVSHESSPLPQLRTRPWPQRRPPHQVKKTTRTVGVMNAAILHNALYQ